MKYSIVLNGKLHKQFRTIRKLAEYLVYSDIVQNMNRSVCFTGNTCEITAHPKDNNVS